MSTDAVHNTIDRVMILSELLPVPQQLELSYRFNLHFHPYLGQLINRLIESSVAGLQAADTELKEDVPPNQEGFDPKDYALYDDVFSDEQYDPNLDLVPNSSTSPHPIKTLDFSTGGAYSVYNWELFYHVPFMVAVHLSKNQRFEEAQRWFHYIFDPTDDSSGPTPERFWQVKPFQITDVKQIEKLLINLATGEDLELRDKITDSIDAWKDAPFRPHVVARFRPWAYMYKTVMAYLDNLIAWGDALFRQDTGESINEATQIYVLAANILGPRPQTVPTKGSVRPQNYANLRKQWREFSVVVDDLEVTIPFDFSGFPSSVGSSDLMSTINSLGQALYFCVPRNDKLLGYWDIVADRLFKIHNSLNIQGIFRQLPLFEPPIDPALLARATAAGLDVGAVVSGVNQPLPLVRFQLLAQKASEICQEVKSLGNNLLSAFEKEDNEALSILRARHERVILSMAETVKYAQWQEAIKSLEGLEKSLANAIERYKYYERLLGVEEEEITKPEIDPLDTEALDTINLNASEPDLTLRDLEVNIAADAEDIAGGKMISTYELSELQLLEDARGQQVASSVLDIIGSYLSLIPQIGAHGTPVGVGVATGFGGVQLSKMISMMASAIRMAAGESTYKANKTAKIGSYDRREKEWAFQSNLAAGEVNQILKQIRAAQIRVASTKREYGNHQRQIRFSEEIEKFLTGEKTAVGEKKHKKASTQDFYSWMKREVRGLYSQCFQFAFDVAKKAERALQHELGDPNLSFLQFGYQEGKEGLLAGEKLFQDIKRMEMAYLDLNQREYELTKHVSLRQVDPFALLQLRTTGSCSVALLEELFDIDGPGHYFRRIKSVAVSIPCVTGPYTGVNCTLTLLKSSIRKSSALGDGYARYENSDDLRFSDYYGSLQSIVTSSGQSDSGLFEANLRDERFLPFENSGVISEWRLQLPANPSNNEPCQFEYDTISDVILHIRYTAREGGELLRRRAMANLQTRIQAAEAAGSIRLFSIRHDFPNAWAKFKQSSTDPETELASLTLELRPEHYPFWAQGQIGEATTKRAELFVKSDENVAVRGTPEGDPDLLDARLGNLRRGALTEDNVAYPLPIGKKTLYFNKVEIDDLWLVLAWHVEE